MSKYGSSAAKHEKKIIVALMKRHGRTFSSEVGIKIGNPTPSALFRWLCASLLFSARIGNEIATEAARALTKSGWTTARKMAAATWEERTRVLNHAGYAIRREGFADARRDVGPPVEVL